MDTTQQRTINLAEAAVLRVVEDGAVVVAPGELAEFAASVHKAMRACGIDDRREAARFQWQYRILLDWLAEWMELHADKVCGAVLMAFGLGLLLQIYWRGAGA